jgi:hypothetical protein
MLVGFAYRVDYHSVITDGVNPRAADHLVRTNYFLLAAVQIASTIQLFNWFPKRYLATIICAWFLMQTLGLASKFYFLDCLAEFPNIHNAEIANPVLLF